MTDEVQDEFALQLPPNGLLLVGPQPPHAIYEEVFGAEIKDFGSAPSRDWRPFLPAHEIQGYGDCTIFSCCNVQETVAKQIGYTDDFGEELNFSDLYVCVGIKVPQGGTSMDKAWEFLRTVGAPREKDCPYTFTWDQRDAKVAALPANIRKYKGSNYSWITGDINSLKNALDVAPVQIGIGLGETYRSAAEVIARPQNVSVWHAIVLTYIDEKGQFYCRDNYNRKDIILAANYPITYAISPRQLPADWKVRGDVDADRLIARFIGKFIWRAEAQGQAYEVFADKLVEVHAWIDNARLKALYDPLFMKVVTPIGEVDFKKIYDRIMALGGSIENEKVANS